MPRSLHRTWAALAMAALAVLIVAVLAGRDFVRDVNAPCPGKLQLVGSPLGWSGFGLRPIPLDTVVTSTANAFVPVPSGPTFHLVYDQKATRGHGYATQYYNVRVLWKEPGVGAACTCGEIPIALSGEAPSDLQLFRVDGGSHAYVVKGRPTVSGEIDEKAVRAYFWLEPGRAHHIQTDRIFSRHHLPLLVVLFALGALVVAVFRSRRAMSYALRIHAWSEVVLTPGGLIESDTGATLGTLEQTRMRQVPPGRILVAPEGLATSGLYRDVPIVARSHVAEGTHARWVSGTMVRLRDARALAVISTACTLLAFAARLIA